MMMMTKFRSSTPETGCLCSRGLHHDDHQRFCLHSYSKHLVTSDTQRKHVCSQYIHLTSVQLRILYCVSRPKKNYWFNWLAFLLLLLLLEYWMLIILGWCLFEIQTKLRLLGLVLTTQVACGTHGDAVGKVMCAVECTVPKTYTSPCVFQVLDTLHVSTQRPASETDNNSVNFMLLIAIRYTLYNSTRRQYNEPAQLKFGTTTQY